MMDDSDSHSFDLDSSNLSGGAYNAATGDLMVMFASGGSGTYHGVPAEIVEGLKTAPSAGRYFHANIRNAYRYTGG
jgi:hypothetical protein